MPNPQWEKDRQALANAYFGGNADSAQSALDALPYSSIPGWSDLDEILVILVDLGWKKPVDTRQVKEGKDA